MGNSPILDNALYYVVFSLMNGKALAKLIRLRNQIIFD